MRDAASSQAPEPNAPWAKLTALLLGGLVWSAAGALPSGGPEGAVRLVPGPGFQAAAQAGFLEASTDRDGTLEALRFQAVPGAVTAFGPVVAIVNDGAQPSTVRVVLDGTPSAAQWLLEAPAYGAWRQDEAGPAIQVPPGGTVAVSVTIDGRKGDPTGERRLALRPADPPVPAPTPAPTPAPIPSPTLAPTPATIPSSPGDAVPQATVVQTATTTRPRRGINDRAALLSARAPHATPWPCVRARTPSMRSDLDSTGPSACLDSAVVDALPNPVLVVDRQLRLLRANAAFHAEFRQGPDAIGRPLFDITGALGASPDFRHAIRTVRPDAPLQGFRFAFDGPTGRKVLHIDARLLDGPEPRLLLAAEDATVRERLGLELRRRAEALERSNEDLQQFAYVASHDLQEPLRMVASYTQLLAETHRDRLGPDAAEWMHHIVDGAGRMQRLVNDLLEYARVTTKARPLLPTPAGAALDAARANLAEAAAATGAVVTCGPMPIVHADEPQLVQLFQNLLSNAFKFHGPDPPAVRIEAQRVGAAWQFSVADNGIGIDPRYQGKLFVLFQRLHTKDAYPGTGIGLALCKRIVERHGGRLWVESAAGKGATFLFTLPAEASA